MIGAVGPRDDLRAKLPMTAHPAGSADREHHAASCTTTRDALHCFARLVQWYLGGDVSLQLALLDKPADGLQPTAIDVG